MELAILSEQKPAKIIALPEEIRRDSPHLRNRLDHEAVAMAVAADPQAVLDAMKENDEASLAAELLTEEKRTNRSGDVVLRGDADGQRQP